MAIDQYSSTKPAVHFREYGRYIQEMIEEAKRIEDRDERQKFVESIVAAMVMLTPTPRVMEDHKLKLWSHVYFLCNNELDVTYPEGMILYNPEMRPEKVNYPAKAEKYRHYGNNVTQLIREARKMPDSPQRTEAIALVAAYMKLAYVTWNTAYVTNSTILSDLRRLSEGELELHPDTDIDFLISPTIISRQMKVTGGSSAPPALDRGPKRVKKKKFKKDGKVSKISYQ